MNALPIPAKLSNMKPEAWRQETLDFFRKYVKNSGKQLGAKSIDVVDVNPHKLWIPVLEIKPVKNYVDVAQHQHVAFYVRLLRKFQMCVNSTLVCWSPPNV